MTFDDLIIHMLAGTEFSFPGTGDHRYEIADVRGCESNACPSRLAGAECVGVADLREVDSHHLMGGVHFDTEGVAR